MHKITAASDWNTDQNNTSVFSGNDGTYRKSTMRHADYSKGLLDFVQYDKPVEMPPCHQEYHSNENSNSHVEESNRYMQNVELNQFTGKKHIAKSQLPTEMSDNDLRYFKSDCEYAKEYGENDGIHVLRSNSNMDEEEHLADTVRNSQQQPFRKHHSRFCCGVFSSRRRCVLTVFGIFILFLAILVVIGYFIFPRLSLDNVIASQKRAIPESPASQAFSSSLIIDFTATVISKSYIDWWLTRINLDSVSLVDPQSPNKPFGPSKSLTATGYIDNPHFPAMTSTILTLLINITINWEEVAQSSANDLNIKALTTYCGANSQSKTINLQYVISFESPLVPLIKIVNQSLTKNGVFSMNCPSSLQTFLQSLKA